MQDTERFIRRFTRGSGMPSLPFSTESWITGKLGDLQAQNPSEHLFVTVPCSSLTQCCIHSSATCWEQPLKVWDLVGSSSIQVGKLRDSARPHPG